MHKWDPWWKTPVWNSYILLIKKKKKRTVMSCTMKMALLIWNSPSIYVILLFIACCMNWLCIFCGCYMWFKLAFTNFAGHHQPSFCKERSDIWSLVHVSSSKDLPLHKYLRNDWAVKSSRLLNLEDLTPFL